MLWEESPALALAAAFAAQTVSQTEVALAGLQLLALEDCLCCSSQLLRPPAPAGGARGCDSLSVSHVRHKQPVALSAKATFAMPLDRSLKGFAVHWAANIIEAMTVP